LEATPPPSSDDPWIETIRCTMCNECTELNDRMFAYDDEKRAYIADPDAGTHRELVEAAETCQVAIIHPGNLATPTNQRWKNCLNGPRRFLSRVFF
jgi:ferredoxin